MRRWDVFQLGRMRHLDLLALWLELNPGTSQAGPSSDVAVAALTKEQIAALILQHPA